MSGDLNDEEDPALEEGGKSVLDRGNSKGRNSGMTVSLACHQNGRKAHVG